MKQLVTILLLAALSACGDGEASGRAAADPRPEAARVAAEAALRGRVRTAEMRGVQVFSQAVPDSMVVCGRARAASNEAYAPYVAIIGFEGQTARVASFQMGTTGAEASRVFVEMVDRCFEGGGPATARAVARAVPPLPNNAQPEAPVAQVEPAGAPAIRVATARTGANIRSAPRGGDVVRSVSAGGRLEVVGEAPGGWYQVAQAGSPIGWVHSSVVDVSAASAQVAERR